MNKKDKDKLTEAHRIAMKAERKYRTAFYPDTVKRTRQELEKAERDYHKKS